MSTTPREIGTLIVVVLKANHLPNKRHIGKQDPYCVVEVNGEKRRTKAIKRGGQHPEWDEEIRFTLYEDVCDILERTSNGSKTPPPLPPKNGKEPSIKGGKVMKLTCYADDSREPDLIGEARVDLTEVLTKGETDEWFNLTHKEKFSGKVYLELTFWSNAPPPEKKTIQKHVKNKQYAGPGTFIPTGEPSVNGSPVPSRIVSASSLLEHSHFRRSPDTLPSLRPSTSLAKLDLYAPPYEQKSHILGVEKVANEFKEFGVSDHHKRRESFPLSRDYTPGPSSSSSFRSSNGYNHSVSDTVLTHSHDTFHGHPSPHSLKSSQYIPHSAYPHELPSVGRQPSVSRGPRHSIPTASSGFMPLPPASNPSNFGTPLAYKGSPSPQYITDATTADTYLSTLPPAPSFPPQSFPHSQSFHYDPSQVPPTFVPSPSAAQNHQFYGPPSSSSHDGNVSLSPSTSHTSNLNVGSRPLPQQPQVIYAQSHPKSNTLQQTFHPVQSSPIVLPSSNMYQQQAASPVHFIMDQSSSSTFTHNIHAQNGFPTPAPPPPQLFSGTSPLGLPLVPNEHLSDIDPPTPPPPRSRRLSNLPQPPYQQHSQTIYQSPLPPPPPSESVNQLILPPPPPPFQNNTYQSGLPPSPAVLSDNQGQRASLESSSVEYR